MYWKIIIVISIVLTTTLMFFLLTKNTLLEKLEKLKNNTQAQTDNLADIKNNNLINNLMSNNEIKKIYVEGLLENKFKDINVPEDKVLFYFPDECPTYDADILLYTSVNELGKYFLPEKNSLILIDKNHKWTKTPDTLVMWKK